MMMSVTRPCFTTPALQDHNVQDQDRSVKTKTDFFLVSDRSCPMTDGLRPHITAWLLLDRSVTVQVIGKTRLRNDP